MGLVRDWELIQNTQVWHMTRVQKDRETEGEKANIDKLVNTTEMLHNYTNTYTHKTPKHRQTRKC